MHSKRNARLEKAVHGGIVKNRDEQVNAEALFLIGYMEDAKWKQVHEACTPLLTASTEFVKKLLPYIVLAAARHKMRDDNNLSCQISSYIN